MLLLPLLLDLPEYLLQEGQNRLFDQLGLESQRASVLSVMNIGVSAVELFSLFASSLLSGLGAGWCFALCGAGFLIGAGLIVKNG